MEAYSAHRDLAATAGHIVSVQTHIDRLMAARESAWGQLLTATARQYRAGQLSDVDLPGLMDAMKTSYGAGFTKMWNATMPWSHVHVPHRAARAVRNQPNSADGTHWVGPWPPDSTTPHPEDLVPVVYVFYDVHHAPVYVGSTEHFRMRMKDHGRDEKKRCVRSWMASPCADREAAYVLEEKLLAEHMPRLNGRRTR